MPEEKKILKLLRKNLQTGRERELSFCESKWHRFTPRKENKTNGSIKSSKLRIVVRLV